MNPKYCVPNEAGTWLYLDKFGKEHEIDVYEHPIKGLCCFSEDFGSSGTGVNDSTDCHVSVQFTGLDFIKKSEIS